MRDNADSSGKGLDTLPWQTSGYISLVDWSTATGVR